MRTRFALRVITERLDYDRADADVIDDTGHVPADLADVLDALESQCWDAIEEDYDGTALCYPADCRIDYRTGDVVQEIVAIRADRPENLDRAIGLYRAREAARLAALTARLAS